MENYVKFKEDKSKETKYMVITALIIAAIVIISNIY